MNFRSRRWGSLRRNTACALSVRGYRVGTRSAILGIISAEPRFADPRLTVPPPARYGSGIRKLRANALEYMNNGQLPYMNLQFITARRACADP
ncbi:MAG: hypothetical protein HDT42_06480 [Ruminococcaceae bacterium]|nr:hypothetical protein [Oscillospiraceae bacterium]